ncbi:MAG: hypothetical protein WBX25_08230 [Rhodomicrobium sp.]
MTERNVVGVAFFPTPRSINLPTHHKQKTAEEATAAVTGSNLPGADLKGRQKGVKLAAFLRIRGQRYSLKAKYKPKIPLTYRG